MLDPSIQFFIYFFAGLTLAFAAVNLVIAVQKGSEKTYLFLGLMGICVGIYYFLFSKVGGLDQINYLSKIALLFFMSSFALLPWFICYYTGYCRKALQWSLTVGMLISYVVLLFTTDFNQPVIWNILAHIVLFSIIAFGFTAANYQRKSGETRSAWLLISALIILALLSIDDVFRVYFISNYPIEIPDLILPLDYFLILFQILMTLKLARDMQHKYSLERLLNLQEKRWGNLLEKVHLLVVGVDKNRNVSYVNPFFLETTGYSKNEIVGSHYINIIPEKDRNTLLEVNANVSNPEDFHYYQNTIVTNYGEEKVINWTIVGMYDDDGNLINSISIGSDITDKEKAIDEIKELKSKLEEENILLKQELGKTPKVESIVGNSDAIKYVLQRSMQVAATDTNVLLEGETGVGKELVTNYIQQNSCRKDKPFVKINCSAIPITLFESELFGHVKGAFTGADRNKKGLVEMANGGTLFLDEIGEFPMDLQPKLLRFLQEGEIVPIGSESSKKVDVRIIAATNRILLEEIENGRFRNDLYYRLYVYPITIPALRNRAEDIPGLVDVFIQKYAKKHSKKIVSISRLVLDNLKKYSWPGNIRELENVIERAVIISGSDTIKAKDIQLILTKDKKIKSKSIIKLEDMERNHILKALEYTAWQIHGKDGAADLLGINPNTLRSRMKKMNIIKPNN